MSVELAVRTAPNPQEALLSIARALDDVLAKLDAQPAAVDAWGGWTPHAAAVDDSSWPAPATGPSSHIARDEEIAAVEEQLANCTDGEDRRALEAKLGLLRDTGRPPEVVVPQGRRMTANEDEIVIPRATPERRNARRAFAEAQDLHTMVDPPLEPAEMLRAFIEGGPLWLYNYDRAGMMTMPEDWRRAFVEDVEETSPADAFDLARDILKDLGPNSQEISLDGLNSQTDA